MAINTEDAIGFEEITVQYTEWGEYHFFASFGVSFGYREVPTTNTGITCTRIWADGELIYDADGEQLKEGLKWYFLPGTEDQDPVPGQEIAYRGQIVLWFDQFPLGPGASRLPTISAEFVDSAPVTIGGAMESFAIRAGYDAEDVFSVNLDEPLIGYVLNGDATLEQITSDMGLLYDFTMTEVGGTITFSHKYVDGAIVIDGTVGEERLAVLSEGNENPQLSSIERGGDNSRPRSISATYWDIDADYEPGNQQAIRGNSPKLTHKSTVDMSVSLPVVATGDDIRSRLFDALFRSWTTRNGHSIRVPAEFIKYNPGEVLQFTVYDATYTGLIVQSTINGDHSVSLSLAEKSAVYEKNSVATQPPAIPAGVIGHHPVNAVLLDIPDIAEEDAVEGQLNVRVALGGTQPGMWRGARLDLARAGQPGVWQPFHEASTETGIGSLAIDAGTTLTVDLQNMTLAELQDAITADTNVVAVGILGRFELIEYGTVTAVDADTVELTDLTRGQFGTGNYVDLHEEDDYVVIVANAPLLNYPVGLYEDHVQMLYRVVPKGATAANADAETWLPAGNSRKPYPPLNVDYEVDGDDIEVTWGENVRFSGEVVKNYHVAIYTTDWDAPKRFVRDLPTAAFTYTADMMAADGVSVTDQLNILVHQYNTTHGVVGWPSGGSFNREETLFTGTIGPITGLTGNLILPTERLFAGTVGVVSGLTGNFEASNDKLFAGTIGTVVGLSGEIEEPPAAGDCYEFTAGEFFLGGPYVYGYSDGGAGGFPPFGTLHSGNTSVLAAMFTDPSGNLNIALYNGSADVTGLSLAIDGLGSYAFDDTTPSVGDDTTVYTWPSVGYQFTDTETYSFCIGTASGTERLFAGTVGVIEGFGADLTVIKPKLFAGTIGPVEGLAGDLSVAVEPTSLRATDYAISAGTTTLSVTVPPETAVGDLMLLWIMARSTITPPIGWSLVQSNDNSDSSQQSYLYQKVAELADVSADVTVTQSASNRQIMHLQVWSGIASTTATVIEGDVNVSGDTYEPATIGPVSPSLVLVSGDWYTSATEDYQIVAEDLELTCGEAPDTLNRLGVGYAFLSAGEINPTLKAQLGATGNGMVVSYPAVLPPTTIRASQVATLALVGTPSNVRASQVAVLVLGSEED